MLMRYLHYFKRLPMLKKMMLIGLSILWIFIISSCKTIFYGIEQGLGQLHIVRNAIPVNQVLADSLFPDSLKQRLVLLQQIRQFAMDTLQLNNSDNYTTVYDQKGEPIVWIVYASEKYRVKPYLWKFPVIGAVPYKGFFKKSKAETEFKKLEKKGFDVRLGTVQAWSTLGYFKDPVLTGMLERDEGALAELIIHELTHSTIYVKSNPELNENLASYVGKIGAIEYLTSKYGKNSTELKIYVQKQRDNDKFAMHIVRGAHQLDSLYKTFPENLAHTKKDSIKEAAINLVIQTLDTINFERYQIKSILKTKRFVPNNAFFCSYITYHNKNLIFEQEYYQKFDGNFATYLSYLKQKYGK